MQGSKVLQQQQAMRFLATLAEGMFGFGWFLEDGMVRVNLDSAFTIFSRKLERWICEAWVCVRGKKGRGSRY